MKIMSSYGIEIKNMNKIFYPTIAVYNKAVSFCISTFKSEWTDIKNLDNLQKKLVDKDVLIRKFSGKLDGYYRVSVGTKEQNEKFLEAFKEVM